MPRHRWPERFQPSMLWFRITSLCLCAIVMCPGITNAANDVLVELNTGRRLRGSAIEVVRHDSTRFLLVASDTSIQARRELAWSRVRYVEARREMLAALTIPEYVEVVVREDRASPARILTLTNSVGDEENSATLKAFLGDRPRASLLMAAPSEGGDRVVLPTPTWPGDLSPIGECHDHVFQAPGVVVGVRNLSPTEAMSPVITFPQAAELVVWARPFNRSGLADWDALEVFVQGRTASGQSSPIRGSLRCSLWGRRQDVVSAYGDIWFEDQREIALMGQWSQSIEPFEADMSGVQRIVLPLAPNVPDHDLTWSPYGLLAVELDIPGQGRLATSSEPIQLRQSGLIRGRAIQEFGSPFLPQQSTSGSVRAIGLWPQSLSGLRPDRRLFSVQP